MDGAQRLTQNDRGTSLCPGLIVQFYLSCRGQPAIVPLSLVASPLLCLGVLLSG